MIILKFSTTSKNFVSRFLPEALKTSLKHLSTTLRTSYRYGSLNQSNSIPRRVTPIQYRATKFKDKVALVDQHSSHTYEDLVRRSRQISNLINDQLEAEVKSERIAFLCPNDVSYITTQWGVWGAGGVAVPLSPSHPAAELEYFVEDSQSALVIVHEDFADKLGSISNKLDIPMFVLKKEHFLADDKATGDKDFPELQSNPNVLHSKQYRNMPAMIIYTSGTTGRPKGVVHTYGSIQAQITDMVIAWGWTPNDVILHVLPLHHVHGIVNVLMTPLFCGATVVMLPKFDAAEVWSKLLNPIKEISRYVTLFMAVPTIYAKLIQNFEQRELTSRKKSRVGKYIKTILGKIRLMVSGSAALPQPIMERWREITGHVLLERYGMSEFGMGLTNSLDGKRIPGAVGNPFPQVQVCIAKPSCNSKGYDVIAHGTSKWTKVTPGCEGEEGELYVKGPNVFKEYLNKPEATAQTFTDDGWFKTGDTAKYEDGVYRILGRTSVDIIKNGGYKISALDVERHLLSHPYIDEAIVVGLPDLTWGQKVAAVVTLARGTTLDLPSLKSWAKDVLPGYQVPSVLKIVDDIPRNAMGKVNKKELLQNLFANEIRRI